MTGGANDTCQGATLDMDDDNRLVGIGSDGKPACRGHDLMGAMFTLRSFAPVGQDDKLTVKIRISDIMNVDTINGETRTAYLLEAEDGGGSLCKRQQSTDLRQALGMTVTESRADDPPDLRGLVIPVRSELYDVNGHWVEPQSSWQSKQRTWLHFACVDDTLAKRSLYDLHSDNLDRSRAALMMLSANYCGNLHATLRGLRIAWTNGSDEVIEAAWGPAYALCMSEPRLLHADGAEAQVPAGLSGTLADKCAGMDPAQCADAIRVCTGTGVPQRTIPRCDDMSTLVNGSTPAITSYLDFAATSANAH